MSHISTTTDIILKVGVYVKGEADIFLPENAGGAGALMPVSHPLMRQRADWTELMDIFLFLENAQSAQSQGLHFVFSGIDMDRSQK